ncbi:MAG: ATP-dependent RNA helicase DbpA [Gammaproteobacteria bacterium 39-13]|nr:ATP-dependent RNA helicase DbpA [Gammaproteobacteria bacterium]OJV94327.1 MAG: ATP-dependent RNA helicase DbpA [Gammaproteobacteria bacterium 39-13]
MNSISFSNLALHPEILNNLETLGYQEMTPVQARSLPLILKNHDIIVKAKTGSGKTAAFGLGILSKVDLQHFKPQALVICPTRELADQVGKEIRRLGRLIPNLRVLTLCGGKPLRMQAESLRHGPHILVATPGRLQDHIEKRTLDLKHIRTLVLDEADRMVDMGFFDTIVDIIKVLPSKRQTLLFSATYPTTIAELCQFIQTNPIEVTLDTQDNSADILQFAYQVSEKEKNEVLFALFKHYSMQSTIIFCNTKKQCDEVAMYLCDNGLYALPIHSDLEQREREEILLQFANNSCPVLVATDVAARGIDIKDLPFVINYDLPSSPEIYVHRIGRTGRIGKSGIAISLFGDAQNFKLETIEKYIQSVVTRETKESLNTTKNVAMVPLMRTLCINGGKKNKMRPTDILGALTGEGGLTANQVGKIDIFDFHSYVAINHIVSSQALHKLQQGKIKGRTFKVRYLDNFDSE